ncbi:uncharacterized protein P174DRAFT_423619 [Aspergillus novofumigatus IBT 16806]|uniref:Uncharacterized protein n=1 Tax=Aspergillus novofumigatus (strain IBT 16806) TaxID=1392255 RepID=A0A2I1BZE9_ASPN1|nr:uncharacterized protein P174DRAFT_423619 [Aspergillus novofumigatus IBT 16806]PKX90756.1 hypothetical protein P174DRAFT_423619 [Aspergillus novofumigatus IBT 16806]
MITWNSSEATDSTHRESGLGSASGIRVKDKIWPGSNTGARRLQEQTMTDKGIAKQAILKGDLPPSPFPLGELRGEICKPNLDELNVLFDFRHLVECLERLARKNSAPYWYDCIESLEPEDRINAWIVWKERLHVALYRSFLAGAAQYRAYQEPLTLASTCGLPGFLDKFRKNMEWWDEEDDLSR